MLFNLAKNSQSFFHLFIFKMFFNTVWQFPSHKSFTFLVKFVSTNFILFFSVLPISFPSLAYMARQLPQVTLLLQVMRRGCSLLGATICSSFSSSAQVLPSNWTRVHRTWKTVFTEFRLPQKQQSFLYMLVGCLLS